MKINPFEAVEASHEAKAAFAAQNEAKMPVDNTLRVIGLLEFIEMDLPARETMLSPWLMTQSLNMIHGWRGVGKTHVSLGVSHAVAYGVEFLGWKADKARRVLLVDGEMPGPALQERLAAIIKSNGAKPESGYLSIITPDLQTGAMPDLATLAGQDAISEVVERVNAKLIVMITSPALCAVEGVKTTLKAG